jgi:hypothetical protein
MFHVDTEKSELLASYAKFDFSSLQEPGLYASNTRVSAPTLCPISNDVYGRTCSDREPRPAVSSSCPCVSLSSGHAPATTDPEADVWPSPIRSPASCMRV